MTVFSPGSPSPVGLQRLLPEASANPPISGATMDSREVRPGWLYAAVPGSRTHGARFGESAAQAGAAAILTDAAGAALLPALGIPVVVVDDVRARLGPMASLLNGRPTDHLTMFGVTGTNGKTTTVSLLAAGLRAAGHRVGTIGTIGFHIDDEPVEMERSTVTTPEAIDLQGLFAHMLAHGTDSVALEVSSHALDFDRVGGIAFDVTGFLNLGHDHLDFHGTQEAYFAAKAKLFEPGRSRTAVVWTDDEHGREIARRIREHGATGLVTVGTSDADYLLTDFRPHGRLGGAATIVRRGEELPITLLLPGLPNMIDAAVALAMLEAADIAVDDALTGLASAQVPGRMERAVLDDDAPLIVVDFAHTPQAVRGAVEALRELGPVTTVIGCGGDRDPEKRPLMGQAAAELSRAVIVTDDNPRTEDPAAIRAATLEGARRGSADVVEVAGRARAIEEAIARTGRDGVVAILGKGHEQGQILADRVVAFDDRTVARDAWARVQGGNR